MVEITYIEHNGRAHKVQVKAGASLMQGALNNTVSGIIGDCGGVSSCGTCHCYIDDAWIESVDPASDLETQMLECVIAPTDNSRLSCQITIAEELDGMVVRLPKSQV